MASLFEGYERRIDQINAVLNSYGISSIEEAEKITKDAGLNVYDQVKKIQPICFENACWAYTVGAAIAISVCPASVLETDWLDLLYLIVNIKSSVLCDLFSFFD